MDNGFTIVPDVLVKEFGHLTALVYGVVYRYSQFTRGRCDASLSTIGKQIGITRKAVTGHIKKLCDAGYLKKVTTDNGATNNYYVTDKLQQGYKPVTESDTPVTLGDTPVTESYTPLSPKVTPPVTESYTKNSISNSSQEHHQEHTDDDAPPAEKTLADFWAVYQTEIGGISSHISQLFGMYYDDGVAVEWMIDAVNIAAENNKRKASYVTGCLDKAIAAKVPPRLVFSTNGSNGNQPQQRTKKTVKDDFGNEMEVYV